MAYCDYSAVVLCNNVRRTDKENARLFGLGVFTANSWEDKIHHGILGDGNVRVLIHKYGLPEIYEKSEDGTRIIKYYNPNEVDSFEYETVEAEYKGYKFIMHGFSERYTVKMTEPNGTEWFSEYGYDPCGDLLEEYLDVPDIEE